MPRDSRAFDGVFSEGYRLVRKGGRVKAAGVWFQSDLLLPYVGKSVFLANIDYWLGDVDAFTDGGHVFIGNLKAESSDGRANA
jgi:hypothetical protein